MNRLNIKRTVGFCLMAMAFFVYPYGSDAREGLCRLCKSIYRQYQPSAGAYLPNRTSAELDAQGLSGKGDFTSDRVNGLPVVVTSHRGSSAFNLSPVQGEVSRPIVSYSYDLEKITPIVIPYIWMRLIYRLSMPLHIRLVFIISVLGRKVIMLWW